MSFKWSDERIAQLKELWKQNLSNSLIADRMGVSKNTIVGRAYRLNLRRIKVVPAAPAAPSLKPQKPKLQPVPVEPLLEPYRPGTAAALERCPDRRDQCRFPMWPHGANVFHPDYGTYCLAKSDEGKSYCPVHHAKCHFKKDAA